MQRLEVSGAVRPIYGSLGVKRLKSNVSVQFYYQVNIFKISSFFIFVRFLFISHNAPDLTVLNSTVFGVFFWVQGSVICAHKRSFQCVLLCVRF